MKIAYIAESIIPSRSANSIHVMKMCQAFAKKGNEVTLLVPNKNVEEPKVEGKQIFCFYGVEKSFDIVYLPWPSIKGKTFIWAILSAVKAKYIRPDIIYGRSLLGCYFSTYLKLPVFFESHHPVQSSLSKRILFKLIQKNEVKGLIVISEALKRFYQANYQADDLEVLVMPDAADPPNTKNSIKFHNQYRIKVGYVGQLYKGKGMEIISGLAENCPWADFHIVGGLDSDIAKWQKNLKGLNNIIFHGFVPHGEIYKYLNSFDILVAPYQSVVSTFGEGKTNISNWMSPLKLFEYMAVGKPILCSDLPVLREIMRDKDNSLLLPPDNLNAWVRALRNVSWDEEYVKYLGDNAQKEFYDNYTWDARAEKLLNVFQKYRQ